MTLGDFHLRSHLLDTAFRSDDPRIGHFPHVLVKSSELTLRALASVVDVPLGLWGERPLLREDGGNYLEPPSGKIIEDFALWKLEANQRYLFQRATVGPDPTFKMFISADTPTNVLERTYEHFGESTGDFGDVPDFQDYINFVCDWIPELHWVFIPLDGELGWSIFAAALRAEPLVGKVKMEFQQNQIPIARLAKSGNRLAWFDEPGHESLR